ncbi:MAG TPA: 50S ribosomal protein L32 [bacterium]
MPNPKRRRSKTRQRKHRAHIKLSHSSLSKCSRCNEPKLPHRVCPNCGYYGDRAVIEVE